MISSEAQTFLLKLARDAITFFPHEAPEARDPPVLESGQGAFVTLQIDEELRGCIGRIATQDPLIDTVKRCAIDAANADPRFPPVRKEEIALLKIEISVLEKPSPLSYKDAEELLEKLSNDMGVILGEGGHSATFLPQVWESLPDKSQFLGHLCMKAGLRMDAWRDGVKISTYKVQAFTE